MAKGLYRLRAREAGCRPEVASAGFLQQGVPVPDEVAEVMEEFGVDLRQHRSRTLTPALVRASDLVLTMTRQQLLDVAVQVGEDWTRCFTIVDGVRRAEAIGSPPPDAEPVQWVRQLHGGRTRAGLLRLSLDEDIADPMNGRRADYERTADRLDDLVSRLAKVICVVQPAART